MPKSFGAPNDQNLLLATLPPELYSLVEPNLTNVRLEQRTALEYPLEEYERIFFPISCVGSMVALGSQDRRIEVGLFGFEGMSGTSIVTGVRTSPLGT